MNLIKDFFKKAFKKKKKRDYIIYSAILILGIVLDQISKLLAVEFLTKIDTLPIIDGVLHLTYVENPGAAFGMLKDAPWVFNTFSVIAIFLIVLYLYSGNADTTLSAISLSMIASGGIGNMIDRATLHYVVDFIDFRLINFAVFNIADSFVCVGAGLLILSLIIELKNEYSTIKKKDEGDGGSVQ